MGLKNQETPNKKKMLKEEKEENKHKHHGDECLPMRAEVSLQRAWLFCARGTKVSSPIDSVLLKDTQMSSARFPTAFHLSVAFLMGLKKSFHRAIHV